MGGSNWARQTLGGTWAGDLLFNTDADWTGTPEICSKLHSMKRGMFLVCRTTQIPIHPCMRTDSINVDASRQ